MKGLLLKDWYVIRNQCKYILLISLLWVVISVLSANGGELYFAIIGSVLLAILPITVMGLDERSHWESFALTMPYSRRAMVLSKYLLSLLAMAASCILYTAAFLAASFIRHTTFSAEALAAALIAIIMTAGISTVLIYPLIFRLGVEKGRIWYMMVTILLVCISGLLADRLREKEAIVLSSYWMAALPAVILALIGLSAWLSVTLYRRREF